MSDNALIDIFNTLNQLWYGNLTELVGKSDKEKL